MTLEFRQVEDEVDTYQALMHAAYAPTLALGINLMRPPLTAKKRCGSKSHGVYALCRRDGLLGHRALSVGPAAGSVRPAAYRLVWCSPGLCGAAVWPPVQDRLSRKFYAASYAHRQFRSYAISHPWLIDMYRKRICAHAHHRSRQRPHHAIMKSAG